MNFYRRFINNYLSIITSLIDLLKGNKNNKKSRLLK